MQEPSKRCELNELPSRLRSPSRPLALLPAESADIEWKWQPISVCHYSCMIPGVGFKLVEGKTCKNCEHLISIKVCHPQKDVSTNSLLYIYEIVSIVLDSEQIEGPSVTMMFIFFIL